jgi:hypothetical protein
LVDFRCSDTGEHAKRASESRRANAAYERPFARVDHMGLLWLVNGGKIIELHRDRAIIETERGARQSYRRRPVDLDRVVVAWELKP